MTHAVIIRGDTQRAIAKRLIDQAPLGYVVTVKEALRSSAQNRRMQAMLHDLAAADPLKRGYDSDGYKVLAMQANGHKPEYIIGLEGEIIPTGWRSRKLTVPQMTELIEWLFWFGAQHEIKWTDPKEQAA